MGSRLRPVPETVLECVIEVSAPTHEQGATLISFYPDTYEDVDMLRDVVPKFCFPFQQDSEMVDAVQHFAFVLTDIDGLYRFGFCRYPPKAKTCLCILSDLPAFDMFYGMLNTLAELEKDNECLTVKQFMDLVLKSDVPKPDSKLTIQVREKLWKRHFHYPDPANLPSIPENRNLTDYFSAVNPNNMIALFASMMFERRIIVTSKKLGLLTACTYSASSLLFPMHWQHVFIPVIPPSLLDYCCAPMPFLVGVHSSLMNKVRDMPLDDVVILDIDKNEIEVPFNDVDSLPTEAVHKLNSALKKSTIAIGDYVSRAFLSSVVVLIGGYRDALKFEPSSDTIIFEREWFVNSRPHMKPFLENLLSLQLFERFVHHRLEQHNAGESIDDIFEELVGQQEENNSKWTSQYKQWVGKRKKNLKTFGGKTEKATHKAHKFFHEGFKNVSNQGKISWKEAMKGLREKKNDIIGYKKGKDDGFDEYENHSGLMKSHSMPMQRGFCVNPPPIPSRKSVGGSSHHLVDMPAPTPKKRPCPARPPPRTPAPRPPPRPAPYKLPAPSKDDVSPGNLRKSMCRNPNDPPVSDLISFFDSQEDLDEEENKADPFDKFRAFDYKEKSDGELETDKDVVKTNGFSSKKEWQEGLLWDTMISLSSDTRQFLRNSRLSSSQDFEKASLDNGKAETDQEARGKATGKKTLKELALNHKTNSITHSGSWPSLLDSKAADTTGRTVGNPSSTYINGLAEHANARPDKNLGLLSQLGKTHSRTNCADPFDKIISESLKLDGLNLADKPPRDENISKSGWVADFD